MLAFFTSALHIHYLVSNLLTLIVLFLTRFVLSDQLIWRAAAAQPAAPATDSGPTSNGGPAGAQVIDLAEAAARRNGGRRGALRGFAYNYDVHGFASVASEVWLPELKHFSVESLSCGADVEIRVDDLRMRPRRRIDVDESPGVMLYTEHLGRMGANFRVEIFDRVRVTVTPLLARSPHVVYTNVVEALLRFVLASHDLALLHSATVVLDGRGVMLSAHTDTGKTATILRMLREHGGVFLSDDMTIVSPDGLVYSYPKPLTISHHTLSAIDGVLQSWTERMTLRLKSSIHSKSGRGTGLRLARMNLPIMSINAITQTVVPPPKYAVDSLVPCTIGVSSRPRHLFLIARGPQRDEAVEPAQALTELIENTDDAYGFPPFQRLAPVVALAGESYPALRRRERSIIKQMLSGMSVRRVVRDDFSWADYIPSYLQAQGDTAAVDLAPAAAADCPEGLCA